MPTADRILWWATSVANDWRPLAIAWHVVLATVLIAFAIRKRPSRRLRRGDATRLIVRVRAGQPYRFHRLPA